MSEEKKTLTPLSLAGYGVATYLVMNTMEKLCESLGNMGTFGVISPGKALVTYAGIVSAHSFIPALCALSFTPLLLQILKTTPRRVAADDYSCRKVEPRQDVELLVRQDTAC